MMAQWETGSLLRDLKTAPGTERIERLAGTAAITVERIVSAGAASPDDFWYDQEHEEWVLLVAGKARLERESDKRSIELAPGDWCRIPPRCRHRVVWTDPDEPTVWLAVHYPADDPGARFLAGERVR